HATRRRAAEQGHTRMGREALRAGVEALGLGVADQQLEPLAEAATAQLLANGTISSGAGMANVGAAQHPVAPSAEGCEAPPCVPTTAGRLRIYEPTARPSSPPAGPTTPAPSPQPRSPDLGLACLVRAEQELADRLLALARRAGPERGQVE